ncbi:unnamed protein product, partial [Iphiclides podalirius]
MCGVTQGNTQRALAGGTPFSSSRVVERAMIFWREALRHSGLSVAAGATTDRKIKKKNKFLTSDRQTENDDDEDLYDVTISTHQ